MIEHDSSGSQTSMKRKKKTNKKKTRNILNTNLSSQVKVILTANIGRRREVETYDLPKNMPHQW
jgi:hypothetical protein